MGYSASLGLTFSGSKATSRKARRFAFISPKTRTSSASTRRSAVSLQPRSLRFARQLIPRQNGQTDEMRRRTFIALLGGAAVAWPLAARAQQAAIPVVGFLGGATHSAWIHWTAAFVRRLRELGWIEGRSIAIEYRWAQGRSERYTEIAAEFVRLKVNVIVTAGAAAAA